VMLLGRSAAAESLPGRCGVRKRWGKALPNPAASAFQIESWNMVASFHIADTSIKTSRRRKSLQEVSSISRHRFVCCNKGHTRENHHCSKASATHQVIAGQLQSLLQHCCCHPEQKLHFRGGIQPHRSAPECCPADERTSDLSESLPHTWTPCCPSQPVAH
jgi:hypothetical protein